MTIIHNLGFPRIGLKRELKFALESYWAGKSDISRLLNIGKDLRRDNWNKQAQHGVDLIPVGDFAWYDHVLEWSATIGAIPDRFLHDPSKPVDIETIFKVARGWSSEDANEHASEMTKWFDTNYHYITPEIYPGQKFKLSRDDLFEEISEAIALGYEVKPVIPGPLTWLWLAKGEAYDKGPEDVRKLDLLDRLIPIYLEVLNKAQEIGAQWVQIDEPILALDIPKVWVEAFNGVYKQLSESPIKILIATYFETISDKSQLVRELSVDGWHIDVVRAPEQIQEVAGALNNNQVLSLGVVDGRNIWCSDFDAILDIVRPLKESLGERLWLAPSCSLLHVPVDLEAETELDEEMRGWLAFAVQKLRELKVIAYILDAPDSVDSINAIERQRSIINSRRKSARIHNPVVQKKMKRINEINIKRTPFSIRDGLQKERLNLPLFPTTTIGSFPQTQEIRVLRRKWRDGSISDAEYERGIKDEITNVIKFQEEAGLDVLVHGEPERNDMVEYFGELLGGFAFTKNGWVQSYGSRCVKPPIIYGDVVRPAPMTVTWSSFAQSLTDKPVKGMLTGPVTMLQWSFVRDDQPRKVTCQQLALALRDEISDLESAGIGVIQIDEPALREGLPLRRSNWSAYLRWAVDCFKLSTSVVSDATQIHTHMCYSEFNDIIESIADMDADVITIETSRSNMELLQAFENFHYPNNIGPGVYDIHSPNIPDQNDMVALMDRATRYLPREHLWVNPDCGLKTRGWKETRAALNAMVSAAQSLRYT